MKISEVLITKHRNSLRNDIVRFPEEIFVKKKKWVKEWFYEASIDYVIYKDYFAKITEELVMKYKDNKKRNFARISLELFMKYTNIKNDGFVAILYSFMKQRFIYETEIT